MTAQKRRLGFESFGGSLPAFVAAFTSSRRLTAEEADAISRIIDDFRKETAK